MEKLSNLLEKEILSMNEDPRKHQLIEEWIGRYGGKVICFRTNEGELYHLVFDREKALMRGGSYSSCEFSYIGPEEVLCAILRKESSAMKAGMTGTIKGWGSVNEAIKFEELLG